MAPLKTADDWTEDDWKKFVSYFKKEKFLAFNPGEREYELSVAPANLLYRYTRPHCVVQPESWTEVRDLVDYAYENKLHRFITVRCGGHSYTGFSTVDKGILVDLKRMREVTLEFNDQNQPDVAIVQAGARWGDVYRRLIEDSYHGYVVNGGRCPSVGVSGFLLGGGLGPFTRSFGMGCDTVVGFTIITLKKGVVTKVDCDAKNDPELFWALRGGGCAAFGVVTEFKLKIQKLKGENVTAARYVWKPNQSWKLIHPEDIKDETERKKAAEQKAQQKAEQEKSLRDTMNAFYTAEWPNKMTIDSNWMMDLTDSKRELGIRFIVYYDGDDETCDKLIKEKIKDVDLAEAITRRTLPEPSTRFLHESLVLMWAEEARFSLPTASDNVYEIYCSFCFKNDAQQIEEITNIVKEEQDRFEEAFKGDSISLWVTFIHSGGEVTDPDLEPTAFPWRECVFQTYVTLKWTDKWLECQARETLIRVKNLLKKYSLTDGSPGSQDFPASYINFSDSTLMEKGAHEIAYYGANRTRLHKLKQERDPQGFFRWPWDKDVQPKTENLGPVFHENGEINETTIFKMAKSLTDKIATSDWTSYSLPPLSYTDIYGTPYVDVN